MVAGLLRRAGVCVSGTCLLEPSQSHGQWYRRARADMTLLTSGRRRSAPASGSSRSGGRSTCTPTAGRGIPGSAGPRRRRSPTSSSAARGGRSAWPRSTGSGTSTSGSPGRSVVLGQVPASPVPDWSSAAGVFPHLGQVAGAQPSVADVRDRISTFRSSEKPLSQPGSWTVAFAFSESVAGMKAHLLNWTLGPAVLGAIFASAGADPPPGPALLHPAGAPACGPRARGLLHYVLCRSPGAPRCCPPAERGPVRLGGGADGDGRDGRSTVLLVVALAVLLVVHQFAVIVTGGWSKGGLAAAGGAVTGAAVGLLLGLGVARFGGSASASASTGQLDRPPIARLPRCGCPR